MADRDDIGFARDRWWNSWYQLDFSWSGLKKKPWRGYSVFEYDNVQIVAETVSREVYRRQSRSSSQLQKLVLDKYGQEWRNNHGPDASEVDVVPLTASLLRPATLQDYWRADIDSGILREDIVLIGLGELVVRVEVARGASEPYIGLDNYLPKTTSYTKDAILNRSNDHIYHCMHLPFFTPMAF